MKLTFRLIYPDGRVGMGTLTLDEPRQVTRPFIQEVTNEIIKLNQGVFKQIMYLGYTN